MQHAFRIDDADYRGCANGPLAAPKSISIDVTSRCNMMCAFCNVNAGLPDWTDMDVDLFKSVIDQASLMGIFEVRIMRRGNVKK